jgi:hypothetical protein
MQRRLAAILAADVVGYSRLMGADEVGTLKSLKLHRHELVDSGISEHHGRIVKTTGDGLLVEFASVVEQLVVRSKFSAAWPDVTPGFPWKGKSYFESESTLATSSLMAMIFLATASISLLGWKRFANPVVYVFQGQQTTRSGTNYRWLSPILASRP